MVPSISICLPYLFLLGKLDCCFHRLHLISAMYDFDGRNKEIYQINFNLIMKGIVKSKKNKSHSVVFIRERRMDCFPASLHSLKQHSNFPSKNKYGRQIVRTLIHMKYLNSLLQNVCIGMFLIIFSLFIRNHQLL